LQVGGKHAAEFVQKANQATVVIKMAVADDQRLDPLGIGTHELHVVDQGVRRISEVDHHRALRVPGARFDVQRQAPLVMQRATIIRSARRRLDLGTIRLAWAQKQIVGAVDQHAHREPVDHRR